MLGPEEWPLPREQGVPRTKFGLQVRLPQLWLPRRSTSKAYGTKYSKPHVPGTRAWPRIAPKGGHFDLPHDATDVLAKLSLLLP